MDVEEAIYEETSKFMCDGEAYKSRSDAEKYTIALAAEEGIFCGISSGGAVCASLLLAAELTDAHIVTIICDRGDRYLTTGVFQ